MDSNSILTAEQIAHVKESGPFAGPTIQRILASHEELRKQSEWYRERMAEANDSLSFAINGRNELLDRCGDYNTTVCHLRAMLAEYLTDDQIVAELQRRRSRPAEEK